MQSRNEFPVRLDVKAINEITNKKKEMRHLDDAYFTFMVNNGVNDNLVTLQFLRAFHQYLVERRIDPGFQVVLGE